MKNEVSSKIELNFPSGVKVIEMALMNADNISELAIDTVIILYLVNTENYTGYFKGIENGEVLLNSLSGKNTLTFKLEWIVNYLEEVKK